jgi:hypothetical protein
MAFVSPLPGDKLAHLQLLLELADDPNDVQTTMDGPTGLAFYVPDELADRYLKAMSKGLESAPAKLSDFDDVETAPVKRKPGRPKKNTDSGS